MQPLLFDEKLDGFTNPELFVEITQQCFALLPKVNFSAHN